ncbi:MAG TPA: LamG-like jellyroll fold domain-containing protein [Nocardioidaceae bacterium]|nr:LamG-like jellyroll fold domain-containing protein [Nocardioidaceae bacterium]
MSSTSVRRVRATRTAVVAVVVVAWLSLTAAAASAAGNVNLLRNGTFEGSGSGSVTGWTPSNAALTVAGDGQGGGFAGRLAASASGTYKITASPKPAKLAPVGEAFRATGSVRSDAPGKSVCLQVVESGAVSRTTQQCVTATSSWTAFPAVNASVAGAGDTMSFVVRQGSGVVGDSFEVDNLSIVDTDTTAPTVPGSLKATAASGTEVDLSWSASSDPSPSGVGGYAVYRNGSTNALATVGGSVTSYKDTSVTSGSTYSYTVAAFDYAQNFSAKSASVSVTTPSSSGTLDTWHMDSTSGGTMVDSTGNHDGTLTSSVTSVAGDTAFPGTGYHFNGTSSKVTIPNAADLNPLAADVHIAFSMRTNQVPATPDFDLFRKGASPQQLFKIEFQPTGQVSCGFTGSLASTSIQAGPDLHDNAWHRVACAKTSSSISLTIDGTTYTKSKTIGSISNTANMIVASHGSGEFFPGDLDELSYRIG